VNLESGKGSATLNINIKRNQNGTYRCEAINNQYGSPVTAQTVVEVMCKFNSLLRMIYVLL
jgi:dTDP-4-dehydrorhamnose reductase